MVLYLVLVAAVGVSTWFAEASRTVTADGHRITQKVLVFERSIAADQIVRASVRTDAFGSAVLVIDGRAHGQKMVVPIDSGNMTPAILAEIGETLERAGRNGADIEAGTLRQLSTH